MKKTGQNGKGGVSTKRSKGCVPDAETQRLAGSPPTVEEIGFVMARGAHAEVRIPPRVTFARLFYVCDKGVQLEQHPLVRKVPLLGVHAGAQELVAYMIITHSQRQGNEDKERDQVQDEEAQPASERQRGGNDKHSRKMKARGI